MREVCGTAAEYLRCRTLPDDLESGEQDIGLEGGFFEVSGSGTSESVRKHIYRPFA
jgi:hypothetical protein